MRTYSRREFVRRAAAVSAAAWAAPILLPSVAASKRSLDPSPFHFGVASGDPLLDRVMIWTRVTPKGRAPLVPVRWEVAADPGFSKVAARGLAEASSSDDYTVQVDVGGLDPGRRYFYRFESQGERSRVGRTRTAPEDPNELKFAMASCQSYPDGFYAAWNHIAGRDLDFVLHLGDYIYEYGGTVEGFGASERPHKPDHEIVTLSDYRTRYANYRSDASLRAAHAAHPFIAVWDDHEVANDRWREGAENHQPEEEGKYGKRRDAGYRAYFEWMPVRRSDPTDPNRLYRDFSFGQLADLFMIDTRTYRDQPHGTLFAPNVDPQYTSEDRTILGDQQERWLHKGLSDSGARWRLVGNQVMVAHLTYGMMPDELGAPLQELTGQSKDGFPVNPDQWDGYQFDRTQLFDVIVKKGIDNTLFLTGDIHTSWANELKVDPDNPLEDPIAAEFVGPSITSANIDEITGAPARTISLALEAAAQANNPHIRWVELDSHGYVLVSVNRERAQGEWYFVDKNDPKAKETLADSWIMRDGDATLSRP